jgi:hypothetical protein
MAIINDPSNTDDIKASSDLDGAASPTEIRQ